MAIPPGQNARWIPIETNPKLFTDLLHELGFSKSFEVSECESFEPDVIRALFPRPILALILCYPGEVIPKEARVPRVINKELAQDGKVWSIRQLIHNACGLYALLHGALNSEARNHINPNSILSHLLTAEPPYPTRPQDLHTAPDLERVYSSYSTAGDSDVPALETEVEYHYTCFIKAEGRLVELNGDLPGPADYGPLQEDEDVVSEAAIAKVRTFLKDQCNDDWRVSLMVLAPPKIDFD